MGEVCVTGRLVYRRRLSKKLVFYDLEILGDDSESQHGIEVMLKADELLTVEDVKNYRDSLKLGDIVSVHGEFESNRHIFRAFKINVKQPWKNTGGGDKSFIPQPLPHHSSNQSQSTSNRNPEQGNEACSSSQSQYSETEGLKSGDNEVQPMCKFWINTGKCAKGAMCPYAHPLELDRPATVRGEWVAARRKARRDRGCDPLDPHAEDADAKSNRAEIFCNWLIDKYGKDLLCSGTGVMDVAGGRGAISFQLQVVHGIPATLIDPRPQKLSRKQHQILKSVGREVELPGQLQCEFAHEMWRDDGEAGEKLRNCSMVVGMHPDQATDAIVNFALEYRKPFAVVPCCVFPRLFPYRRHVKEDGELEKVIENEQLVQYLVQKGQAQREFLKFEGRNQVVFRV